jgi:hypothetical protein
MRFLWVYYIILWHNDLHKHKKHCDYFIVQISELQPHFKSEGKPQPCILGEVDFWFLISYSLQLMGKISLRLK